MQTNGGTSLPVTRAPNGVTSPPMPNVKELMVEGGVMATKFYIHTPICCPSRAETLSGRYLHNVKRPVAEGQCADGCVRVCLPRRCRCLAAASAETALPWRVITVLGPLHCAGLRRAHVPLLPQPLPQPLPSTTAPTTASTTAPGTSLLCEPRSQIQWGCHISTC